MWSLHWVYLLSCRRASRIILQLGYCREHGRAHPLLKTWILCLEYVATSIAAGLYGSHLYFFPSNLCTACPNNTTNSILTTEYRAPDFPHPKKPSFSSVLPTFLPLSIPPCLPSSSLPLFLPSFFLSSFPSSNPSFFLPFLLPSSPLPLPFHCFFPLFLPPWLFFSCLFGMV